MKATPASRDESHFAVGIAAPEKVAIAGFEDVARGVVTGLEVVTGVGVVATGVETWLELHSAHETEDDASTGVAAGTDEEET